MSDLNNFQLVENFNLQEFECTHPTHSHVQVSRKLVDKLQELRNRLGGAVIITSAFRCEERNRAVGGATNSQHMQGRAVDITLRNQEKDISEIAEMAIDIGFTGIGYYSTFIHLDVRQVPAYTEQDVVVWDKR